MLDKFISFIGQHQLFNPGDKILLGVSGGIDSMVMTDLFVRAGIQIEIAHCNFQLRGSESDDDEQFVKAYASQLRTPFHTIRFETQSIAESQKVSIQMAARELRMDWFFHVAKEKGIAAVATAHHLDDQVETFFINLLRGTGLAGLHGMLPKSGQLIHPLLFTNRVEIEAYAKSRKMTYREDSSNLKTKYLRNNLRLKVIPELEKIKPGFSKILAHNMEHFRSAERILTDHMQATWNSISFKENEMTRVKLDELKKLPEKSTYLHEFLKPFGFNTADALQITGSLESHPGKHFLSKTHRITLDREYLLIESLRDPVTRKKKFQIPADALEIDRPVKLKISAFQKSTAFMINPDPRVAQLDRDLIKFPLTIRHWKKGDFFYPLGMKGKKLLSDFFTDQKVSQPEKENCWLLESDGNIIWVIGYRIDDRFKISHTTKSLIEFVCDS